MNSGLLSDRRAILLVSVFAIPGALLQDSDVMKTLTEGIVTSDHPMMVLITALLCAEVFVTV